MKHLGKSFYPSEAVWIDRIKRHFEAESFFLQPNPVSSNMALLFSIQIEYDKKIIRGIPECLW